MPVYTVSQPKVGFPTIYQHGLPWLALECPEKARAISEAMNREPAVVKDELRTEVKEIRRRVADLGGAIYGTPTQYEVTELRRRVLALEHPRRRSLFGWR